MSFLLEYILDKVRNINIKKGLYAINLSHENGFEQRDLQLKKMSIITKPDKTDPVYFITES